MLYIEYEDIWDKIRVKEKEILNLINQREDLFNTTQPKASKLDSLKVDGASPVNAFDEYVIKIDELNTKIDNINKSLDDRYILLKRKRDELKASKNIYDRIYVYRYIERLPVFKIGMMVGYEKTQVYRYLKIIKKNINMQQNATNYIL